MSALPQLAGERLRVDGILNVNKPADMTSFDVVARVKRLTGARRVGHAGTLDPLATGVLLVCLGRATRVIPYLMDATKTYHAEVELGRATDTYDTSGKTIAQGDPSRINREQLEQALNVFRGNVLQTPPMFSALKYHGQPLYKLARAGITVPRPARPAQIYRLEITAWRTPMVTLEVDCGKGTYIRSLAHDLGQSLGCGANLKGLARVRCGIFGIGAATSLEQLETALAGGYWRRLLYPVDAALRHWPAAIFNEDAATALRKGCPVALSPCLSGGIPEQPCRAYDIEGRFLAVLRFNPATGQWHPERVFLPFSPPDSPESLDS